VAATLNFSGPRWQEHVGSASTGARHLLSRASPILRFTPLIEAPFSAMSTVQQAQGEATFAKRGEGAVRRLPRNSTLPHLMTLVSHLAATRTNRTLRHCRACAPPAAPAAAPARLPLSSNPAQASHLRHLPPFPCIRPPYFYSSPLERWQANGRNAPYLVMGKARAASLPSACA